MVAAAGSSGLKGKAGRPSHRNVARLKRLAGQIGVGIAFLALWQLVYMSGVVKPLISRSPGQVFWFFVQIATDGTLLPALYSTVEATVVAFVLASFVGVVIGIGLGLFPKVEELLDPYISAFNAMPRIAFAPVFILLFGVSQAAKIALAFSVVVFILMVNARAGIRTVDRDIRLMVTVMNISKRDMFMKILLPSAVPSIFAGLRLGIIYSLLGVVTSEILASRVGLGQLIAGYAGTFQLEGVYAVCIVLAVIASLLNAGMALLERYLLGARAL
ncbi:MULTISPECIES: ABC transporter permease [unclassified Mesorhizobium]|uniref:ABC transporter permease n=1 Tax=unclassified Mesorhizobium TaxID=325217 RepID=UPI001AECD698|nr:MULTISPECIES: ABC transporter permease [unclassified Mesorhizobium]